jgi:P27 family predicted phage terminase small subunit
MKSFNLQQKPPRNLTTEAKKLWRQLVEEFEISDAAGFLLLGQTLEAYDELRAAQAILKKDGPVIKDRWGRQKQHPAALCVRDARNLLLRSLKAFNLDIAPDSPLRGGK